MESLPLRVLEYPTLIKSACTESMILTGTQVMIMASSIIIMMCLHHELIVLASRIDYAFSTKALVDWSL